MTEPVDPEVAILNAALDLSAGERTSYLDQACAGDAALRQQVESLLQAHLQAEGFLEAQVPLRHLKDEVRAKIPLTEKAGDIIGRY